MCALRKGAISACVSYIVFAPCPDLVERRIDEIRSLVLGALIAGRSIDDIAHLLRPYHHEGSTVPAAALMELAADAYLACGSNRTDRLEIDGLAE